MCKFMGISKVFTGSLQADYHCNSRPRKGRTRGQRAWLGTVIDGKNNNKF